MKRPRSSDSFSALVSLCPNSDEQNQQQEAGHGYSREFQAMLDGLDSEGCVEESGRTSEKKRRLGLHQVKALEKIFEVENKLEPERKVKLARELGLQRRQVAVWFQNRRARWKTKQLERDYGVLKSNYDDLKCNFDSLKRENESLTKEIRELKSKTPEDGNEEQEEDCEGDDTELIVSEPELKLNAETNAALDDTNAVVSLFTDLKEGFTSSTDSDTSAILNDTKGRQNGGVSSNGVVLKNLTMSTSEYHPDYVKAEERSLIGDDEGCDFFSEEQAPTLHWYCPDQWT